MQFVRNQQRLFGLTEQMPLLNNPGNTDKRFNNIKLSKELKNASDVGIV